jgi:ankyrin repeat protein
VSDERRKIRPKAFPVVHLKKELIEYKLDRLNAALELASRLALGASRDSLLDSCEALLRDVGFVTYTNVAVKYWALRLESFDVNAELRSATETCASIHSIGSMDASEPLRAVFDRSATRLVDGAVATREECDAMMAASDVHKTTSRMVDAMRRHIVDPENKFARTFTRVLLLAHRELRGAVPLLVEAAKRGTYKIVHSLILAGVDLKETNDYGETAILIAARKGYERAVMMLKEAGADLTEADDEGTTPAIAAARGGHVAVMSFLISAGVDVDEMTNDGRTLLCTAARFGRVGVVNLLVDAGADVNKRDGDGMTPLLWGIRRASTYHRDVPVELLLEDIPDALLDERNDLRHALQDDRGLHLLRDLFDAIHMKRTRECESITAILVGAGADVNASFAHPVHEDEIETPLQLATRTCEFPGHYLLADVANTLIEAGSNLITDANAMSEAKEMSRTAAMYMYRGLIIFSRSGNLSACAASAIVQHGHFSHILQVALWHMIGVFSAESELQMARDFIGAGADLKALNAAGALNSLTSGGRQNSMPIDLARILLEAGADVDNIMDAYTSNTPLMAFILGDSQLRVELVHLLIESGADVNKSNRDGWTPLWLAHEKMSIVNVHTCEQEPGIRTQIVSALIHAGADVDVVSPNGDVLPPEVRELRYNAADKAIATLTHKLHVAIFQHDVETMESCLQAGASVEGISLHEAAVHGHETLLRKLIESGADVNHRGNRGKGYCSSLPFGQYTPLYIAARYGHVAAVKLLLDAGADVNGLVTCSGQFRSAALYAAAGQGHVDVVKILLGAGARTTEFSFRDGDYRSHVELVPELGGPMSVAAREGHVAVVKTLIAAGVPVDYEYEGRRSEVKTPLYLAARHGHVEVVAALLEAGADPNLHNEGRMPALHAAALFGHDEVVRALIRAGADVHAKERATQWTAIEAASAFNHESVLRILLDAATTSRM